MYSYLLMFVNNIDYQQGGENFFLRRYGDKQNFAANFFCLKFLCTTCPRLMAILLSNMVLFSAIIVMHNACLQQEASKAFPLRPRKLLRQSEDASCQRVVAIYQCIVCPHYVSGQQRIPMDECIFSPLLLPISAFICAKRS